MAQAFNLTAQLNLRGPSNIKQIVSDIKKELGTVTGDIKFKIDPSAINNVSKLNQSLQDLNRNLSTVAGNAQAATNAIRNFGQSVNNISSSSSKLSNNLAKTSKATADLGSSSSKTAKNISVTRTEMEEFGRQSALAVRRFAAFSAVTGVFFSLNRAINNGLKSFIEFDRQLVKLQQVTGKNAEGLQSLQDEITRLSIGLGVSSDSLIQVSATLAQAGLGANETRVALEALAKSSLAPSFEDINQTVEGSIALMRQFGIGAKDLEKALGSVNAVAAAFAVESGDIISAIQRTGGVFASASKGVSEGTDSLNEFIAVFTSVRATTRESAETIATGLRTIFTRIQRQGTIEALREFGVTLTDAEGKFVGAYKAVQLLSEGLNRIDPRDLKFSQIVEELGGFRQIGKVIPLIQQFATAQEALKVAQAGQGSLTADAVKAQLSLAVQISKVREEFLSLIRSLGQSDMFQTLAKGALGLASGLIKISGALKGVLPALAIISAGAGLRGLTQFTGGFIGGLKKVRPRGAGGENQSVAGAIGSNLGASLVGAKTEQVSRDLDQNSTALDKVSGKLDDLTTSLNSLNSNFANISNILNTNNTLLQQSITSLTSNTTSLDNLTNAINNLNLGGGPTTIKNGGRILGFAKGGTVPGKGKGDKIPALLEPGEVVMSNTAVNRYGRGNLVRMNRYAAGGSIINDIGGVPASTNVIRGKDNEKVGFDNDSYYINADKQTIKIVYNKKDQKFRANRKVISATDVDSLINNDPNAYETWENISAQVLGATKLNTSDPNYPVDLISGKKLYDAKFRPESGFREREAVLKALSYRLEQTNSGYRYNQSGKTIKLSKFLGQNITQGPDSFQDSGSITFVYPEFKDIPTNLPSIQEGMKIRKRQAQNLPNEGAGYFARQAISTIGDRQYISGNKDIINLISMPKKQKFNGGLIQSFMAGGATKSKKPKEIFGTGETTFPSRIKKKYAEEKQRAEENLKAKLAWDEYPDNERITIDESKVQEKFQQPFDRAKFIDSFKQKITRNSLFSRMADFAKFIGLPQEDLSLALPLQLDFGGSESSMWSTASFRQGARGTRPYDGYDLSKFGYGEAQQQEAYGIEKLIEAKKKELKKIEKTPLRTFDDGSFSVDNVAYSKAYDELKALQTKKYQLEDLKAKAQKAILAEQENIASSTSRGTVSFGPPLGRIPSTQNSVLYHELTHQLFKGLQGRSADSFAKYRERVNSLFSGDNDDLADAFDALTSGPGGGYSSADVVYGRSYKISQLQNMLSSYYRQGSDLSAKEPKKIPEDITKNIAGLSVRGGDAKRAREFRLLNPKVNEALLTEPYGVSQQVIDKYEDIGKEEFLTTLIQKAPELDQNLQGILDSTLTDLLSGAGIQRQKYASGGIVQKLMAGGELQKAVRRIGIIDSDVLRDPTNVNKVAGGMKALGTESVADYTIELIKLAVKARQANQLRRVRTIAGAAGSGKSSLATGMGANDDASLRKTIRSQILTPDDIKDVDEAIAISANVSEKKLEQYLRDVDRVYTLSSSTKEEQDLIRQNKKDRDITKVGLYNRDPGSTSGVSADFGAEEATLIDELGSKNVVLGRKKDAQGKLTNRIRRKRGDELPEIVQAAGFYTGGFAPPTLGHKGAFDTLLAKVMAKNPNASAKDILISVAPNLPMVEGKEGLEHAARYGIFDEDFRYLLSGINFKGAMISQDAQVAGALPRLMEVPGENNRRKFARLKGAMAVVSGKDEGVLGKYERAGINVANIPRIDDISATQVRDYLFKGNYDELEKIVSPEILGILKGNQAQLKNRSVMVPVLIEQINEAAKNNAEMINAQIEEILQKAPGGPYRNVSKQLRESRPDIVEKISFMRRDRENFKKIASGFKAHSVIAELARDFPEIYGIDPDRKAMVDAKYVSQEETKAHLGDRVQSALYPEKTPNPESSLLESIKQRVTKQIAAPKGSGDLPTDSKTIVKALAGISIPADGSYGIFAGKRLDQDIVRKVWRTAYDPIMSKEKIDGYTAVRELLKKQYNDMIGVKSEELQQAITESQMFGLAGLLPIGHSKLSGPFTWNLGKNAAGEDVSVNASIIERGISKEAEQAVLAMQQRGAQNSELFASDLGSIIGKKEQNPLSKSQLEVFGQGNIEGATVEQGLARLHSYIDNISSRTRPVDFPDGLGEDLAKLFPGILPNIPTEIKRTIDSDSRSDAMEEFQRHLRLTHGIPEPKKEESKNKKLAKAMSTGGVIRSFARGGKVPFEAGIKQSPFDTPKSSVDYYSLEKNSGFNNKEFNELVKYAKTNDFSLSEFKKYLSDRLSQKKQKSGLMTEPRSLQQFLLHGTTTPQTTDRQKQLAESLKGPVDAQYDPKYDRARGYAGGGAVSLYHGSNTGVNDSVLESFKKEGAKSGVAQGYGQGAGFYVYSGKEKAKEQAQMRVKSGLGSFAVVSGDTAGKPMVLTFKEMLDPATWDLDYELNKGSVVKWLVDNFDKIKDKVAPKLTANEKLTGIKDIVKPDSSKGIMSSGVMVQSDIGSRSTIYSGTDSNIREGELIGQIMNRLQQQDPQTVYDFENTFFKSPSLASGEWNDLALKYVGQSPLKPTNIETFASGGSVPALVSNGEAYVPPKIAKKIGYGNLNRMNQADKNGMTGFASGGISVFKGPGSGTSDSIGPVGLPVGSFVIREKATKALGLNKGGSVGVQKFAAGSPGGVGASKSFAGFDFGDKVLQEFLGVGSKATAKLTALTNVLTLGAFTGLFKAVGGVSRALDGVDKDLKRLDGVVPGLADAIIQNGLANKRSIAGQALLVEALFKLDDASLALAKTTLEANTALLTNESKTSAGPAPQTTTPAVPIGPPQPPQPPVVVNPPVSADDNSDNPARPNKVKKSDRTLTKEERKARKEQYTAQTRGGVTREEARAVGAIREDFGAGQQGTKDQARVEKQKRDYEQSATQKAKDESKAKYQQLYDEEKQAIKAYYTAKAQQAQKEGKDVSSIIEEYKSVIEEVKANMESALRAEVKEKTTSITSNVTSPIQDRVDTLRAERSAATEAPDKALKDASIRAAEALSLMTLKAQQNGQTLAQYQNTLKQNLVNLAKDIQQQLPGKINEFAQTLGSFSNKIRNGDTDAVSDATKALSERLSQIAPSLKPEEIEQTVGGLIESIKQGNDNFANIIANSSDLQKVFSDAAEDAGAFDRALIDLSASTGIPTQALEKLAEAADVTASNMIDKNAAAAEKMASVLTKVSLGVGAFGSILSSTLKSIGGTENRGAIVAGAAVGGATSTASTLMAGGSQALSQLSTASKMGGSVGNLAGSLLPMAKSLIAGPFGIAATAAISLAAGFKDAYNAAREFDLNITQKRLDESLSRVSDLFNQFDKDSTKVDFLKKIDKELSYGSGQLMKNLQTDLTVPKAFWINMLDTLGGGGSEAAGRSMIAEKEGSLSYLKSFFDNNYQQQAIARLAPEKAVQTAQKAQPQGQNILRQFENKLKSGQSMDDILSELNEAGNQTAQVLARMNPKINEQIMLIENDSSISKAEQKAEVDQLVAAEATRVATINMKNSMKQLEFDKLNRSMTNFATSLERMFSGMEQAINKTDFEISKLSRSAELSSAALSGNAKAGDVNLDSINVLQNPRGYSGAQQNTAYDQAAGFFGSQSGLIRPLLGLGDKLESTVLSTINNTVKGNPGVSTEGIASNIRAALDKNLKDLGLPPEITDKLAKQTKTAFEKIRSERGGEDVQLSFDQVVEEVPAFAKAISSAQRAQELATKAMEFYQKNVNEYAQAMNQMVEYQVEANSLMRKANDIQTKGTMELSRTLGKRVTLEQSQRAAEAPIKSMTGGLTDARDIGRNILNLDTVRANQQAASDSAANRGPAAKDEFMVMQNRLRNTNTALRENYEALKQMADSTELAQAALAKIQEVQAARQAGANLIEKMVTSSPEELAKLNASIGRLNNNMKGGVNFGTTAEQRGESLQAFNMIAPMLGDGQKQNELKANVLESMLKESNISIDSTFQGVIDSLRNPEGDPQMAEAISIYQQSLAKQTEANTVLGELKLIMNANTADVAAAKIATAISGVKLTFEQQVFNDIRDNIARLVNIVGGKAAEGKEPMAAAPKSKGGIIYAAAGQMVDFQSKGTDTVPAMLTPGEFVVNRSATKANLPLLQSINNGYSNGGKVRYYQDGGYVMSGGYSTYIDDKESDLYQGQTKEEANKQRQVSATQNKQNIVNRKSEKVKRLPVVQQYADSDLISLGTIKTNSFMSVGPDGRQTGIGTGFRGIDFKDVSITGDIWSNWINFGFNKIKDNEIDYIPEQFYGISNINKIIKPGDVPVDANANKNIVESYFKLLDKLYKGPSKALFTPEQADTNIGMMELPEMHPNIQDQKDIYSDAIFTRITNIVTNAKKKYWGLFKDSKPPKLKAPGGVGFADFERRSDFWSRGTDPGALAKAKKLADSPAFFAPGLENVKTYRDPETGSEGQLYKSNNIEYLNNTKSIISQLRGALKSLGRYDNTNIGKYGEGKGDSIIEQQQENTADQKIKNTIAKLDALYKNKVFSIDIDDPDYVEEPITLFNIADEDKWNSIFSDQKVKYEQLKQNDEAPKTRSDWTKLTQISNAESKDFPWLWRDADIDKNALFAKAQSEKMEQVAKDIVKIEQTPLGSENGRYFIPAQTITAPFIDSITKNYTDPQKYIYIPPNAGGNPEYNPLYSEKPIVYKGEKSQLEKWLNLRLPSWDMNTRQPKEEELKGFPNIKLENGIGFINPINKSSYDILKDLPDEQSRFLINSEGLNPILEAATINATAYKNAREKRIANMDLTISKQKTQKASGDRFQKLTPEEKAFSAANRVKIAQVVQGYASKGLGSLGITIPTISKIEDVGGVAGYLNSYQSKFDNKSREFATINAWRGLFSSLFTPTPNTVGYLKTFGISADGSRVPEDAINQIINREIAIALSKNIDGTIPENSLNKLELDNSTKLYKVQADGTKTPIKPEDTFPKTIAEVENIALTPENLFENATKRQDYLSVLSDFFSKNQRSYPSEFLTSINKLKEWYGSQDLLLNAGLQLPQLDTSLMALKQEKINDDNLIKAASTIENKKDYDDSNKLLTGEKNGALPDTNRMMDLIKVRKNEVEEESKKQKTENPQTLATGGLVYASNGSLINFQPRGTDTVPAMLTPGEFVINRDSTQKYRPVLEAINNGNYSRGGIVNYLSNGGYLPLYRAEGGGTPSSASFDFTKYLNGLAISLTAAVTQAFDKAINNLKQPNNGADGVSTNNGDIASIDNFVNRLNNIANILSNIYIPPQITITGKHDVVVTINGDTVLNQLRPDIAGIVVSAIKGAFRDLKAKNPENNTINFDIDINPSSLS